MKEKRLEKADYFLHRISLTGLVGGLLLVAIWYFPVYAVLPGNPVWENGTALLGWILTVVGLAVPGLSGFVAARRAGLATRRGNGLAGMFAGGLAAWVAYFGLVGAGTAVLGSLDIIEHGPTLSGREGTFLWLIVQGVMGVVNWSYGGMTAVILLGLFLGWIGGRLTPVVGAKGERNWARQRDNLAGIGVSFTLSGLLTLVVTAFVYAPLGVEMRRAVDESVAAGFTITHSAAWADVLPVLVALAVYLTGLTAVFYLLRQNQQSDDAQFSWNARLSGLLNGGVAIVLPLLLAPSAASGTTAFKWALVGGTAVSLGMGLALLRQTLRTGGPSGGPWRQRTEWAFYGAAAAAFLLAWLDISWIGAALLLAAGAIALAISRDALPAPARPDPARLLAQTFEVFLPATLALVLPTMVLSSPALGIVLLIIPVIPHLTPGDNGLTASFWSANIKQLFVTHHGMFLITIVFGIFLVGIVVGVLRLLLSRAQRKMA